MVGLCLLFTFCISPRDPNARVILEDMKRVPDWQFANPSKHSHQDWTNAPFFLELSNLYQASGETEYLDAVDDFGKKLKDGPGAENRPCG